MKLLKWFALLSLLAPFIICDPQAGVQFYKVTWEGMNPIANVPAQPDGSVKMDISMAPQGVNRLTFSACLTDPIWGELCSSSTPFEFGRPAMPGIPGNLKLLK